MAHLRVGVFCKFHKQTFKDGVVTGLWRGCGWKQLKWYGEDLTRALQRMQTGLHVKEMKNQIIIIIIIIINLFKVGANITMYSKY